MDDNRDDATAVNTLWQKLKSIKHIKLIAAVALVALIALIAAAAWGSGDGNESQSEATLETRLADILSEMDGVGKCMVMITYDGEGEKEIAYEQDSESNVTTDSDGSGDRVVENSTSHSRPITVTVDGVEQVLVVSSTPAPIRGVVVVAEGGADIAVKLRIIDAICALVDVEGLNVKVFAMNG